MESAPLTLSTGEAAKLAGVEADTVLKWIKRGWLAAVRTAGGHHRVDARDLERLLRSHRSPRLEAPVPAPRQPLRCWEYFSPGGGLPEACAGCVVYRVRAAFCFELAALDASLPHARRFCRESCGECPYFRRVHRQPPRVLIASPDPALAALEAETQQESLDVRVARNAYAASAVVAGFRPDVAVVDAALGAVCCRELISSLADDPRVAGVHILLAAARGQEKAAGEFPAVAGIIQKPFTLKELRESLEDVPVEGNAGPAPEGQGGAAPSGSSVRPRRGCPSSRRR